MNHLNHQSGGDFGAFLANFKRAHEEPRPNQLTVLKAFPANDAIILQAPTGTGKTALGYTFLKTHCGPMGNGFYVCPNKNLVDGVVRQYPEITPMYGRNEYPCLLYKEEFQADEIPCNILKQCPHRVSLETGQTFEPGAEPCPYLLAKFKSRNASLVACTSNYYFFEALVRSKEKLPDAVVMDEVHEWSDSIRRMLSYSITDYHLDQFWELLSAIEAREEAKMIRDFKDEMIEVLKQHESGKRTPLLDDESLKRLLRHLLRLRTTNIDTRIKEAIGGGKIDIKADMDLLKELDRFVNDLYRYIKSLEFALETADKKPLSFCYGYWSKEIPEGKKVQYVLTIQSYSIAGLTKAKMIPDKLLAMSATIGDPTMLSKDTGITGTFIDLTSDFPIENSKIFMPNDVVDLSEKNSRRGDKNKMIRKMLQGVKKGKENGIRSLIVVVSEKERLKCLEFAKEEGVDAISYGPNLKAKDAVRMFKDGQGDVLIGTESQYGQGIDLPDNICGFIFYLRPGYPMPDSPQAQFEGKRYGNSRWGLWNWRVINKLMQVRGRNQRSSTDFGCIILMSQQFKRFTYGGLPDWLKPAYESQLSFDTAIEKGINMFKE